MPFYTTDDITCYMFSCITENNEGLEKSEMRDDKKTIEDIVYNRRRRSLRDLCETYLDHFELGDTLTVALLNSIDIDKLIDLLRDWIADLDVDETDEDEPVVC